MSDSEKIEWIQIVDENGTPIGAVSKDWHDYASKVINEAFDKIADDILRELSEDKK